MVEELALVHPNRGLVLQDLVCLHTLAGAVQKRKARKRVAT